MRLSTLPLSWPAPRAHARAALERRTCTPAAARLWPGPGWTVPERAQVRLGRMADGVALRTAFWPARAGRARGTIWLLQGRADCIEKYLEVIAELLARGFAVATFDWRGQGGSERVHPDPRRNHLSSLAPLVEDLETLMLYHWPQAPRPFLGLAHSMGGNVLLQALGRNSGLVEAAVLTAPLIRLSRSIQPPGAKPLVEAFVRAGLADATLPGDRAQGEVSAPFRPTNLLTSCRARYEAMAGMSAAAPHLTLGRPTYGWVKAAMDGMGVVADAARSGALLTPMLVVAGDADRVTCTRSAAAFCERVPAARMVRIEDCAHEVMLERDDVRTRFWDEFDGFVAPFTRPGA